MLNQALAQALAEIADLLEIQGETPFRVNAYREAARRIAALATDIAEIHRAGQIRTIPGVGPSLAARIEEFLTTGRIAYLEELRRQVPPGLRDLLRVPGLGPKRAWQLYRHLGITGVAELLAAVREQRLRTLPGFGAKLEAQLRRALERWQDLAHRRPLGEALPLAEGLSAALAERCSAVQAVTPVGSLRRWCETVGDLTLLVASAEPAAVVQAFVGLPLVRAVLDRSESGASILTESGVPVALRIVPPEQYGAALLAFTGSAAHYARLCALAARRGYRLTTGGLIDDRTGRWLGGATEEEVYAALGLPWIPPELREDQGEIEAALAGRLPALVEVADLQGDLHCHSDWSDGAAALETMVQAAVARGRRYLAITDHSQSLGVARGLSVERLQEQWAALADLQARFPQIRLLRGIELEIRPDGTLDYPDEVLRQCDFVTASIHSGFQQSRERITARLVAALAHPLVDAVSHPRGRIIGGRAGYELDLEAVIAAAARYGKALEINANPNRLDLDDRSARRAAEQGVPLLINTDAHAPGDFDLLRYGVAVARRAGLGPAQVLNTRPPEEFLAWLARRRRG